MASRDRGESGTRSLTRSKRRSSIWPLRSRTCPRELAVNFTDTNGSFGSEATVYRLLKDHGLITSPAFILMKAADRFANPTTAPNQLWQTDFTYLKVIGWGWFYLSTVLDDFSRYILAWKLCTTMSATFLWINTSGEGAGSMHLRFGTSRDDPMPFVLTVTPSYVAHKTQKTLPLNIIEVQNYCNDNREA